MRTATTETIINKSYSIGVNGLVQGVGFRPFVHQLARKYNLKGEVYNTLSGITIRMESRPELLDRFLSDLQKEKPAASCIRTITCSEIPMNGFTGFTVRESTSDLEGITGISPDIAVCPECLRDMEQQQHRLDYPLINCTRCGPRFTIIRELPYDRQRTSMQDFQMCATCSSEYRELSNRRFHAQPVACNQCGPRYVLHTPERDIGRMVDILKEVKILIDSGGILAMKGTGGYHFLCNALDNKAVSDLRIRKGREKKPFAVMFRDLKAIKSFCALNELEEEIITSWRSPVVLLTQKNPLAEAVSSGLGSIGAILPYMPVHHLIFRQLDTDALVFTSGNLADEPVVTDDADALLRLHPVTPYILFFNREIVNRADDSVVKVAAGKVCMIRRSRGYVPEPVELDVSAEGILAFGAEQKNCFCIGKDHQALMGQHIGDLKGAETFAFYEGAMEKFIRLFRFNPRLLVCDRHPGYLSSLFAAQWSEEKKLPLFPVQHHHAHLAACMAEHHLNGEVTGISLDGTGFGDDGHIWGGEFMIANRNSFLRYAHFDYIPMPGGDKAVTEPWRMAFSYLNHYPPTRNWIEKIPVLRDLGESRLLLLREMTEKQVNSPWSSGAGRLFDAVAVILGLCHTAGFDAEPPMRLESIADGNTHDSYPYILAPVISFEPVLDALIRDLLSGTDRGVISARFHNTVACIIAGMTERIREERNINQVVLSGGVFQNKYLLSQTVLKLGKSGFRVFYNHQVPLHDGGIALGQLLIASENLSLCV